MWQDQDKNKYWRCSSFGITLKSSNGTGVLIQSEQNRKTQLKKKNRPGMVAHSCNPSNSRGGV
jgi:hypothetical protein